MGCGGSKDEATVIAQPTAAPVKSASPEQVKPVIKSDGKPAAKTAAAAGGARRAGVSAETGNEESFKRERTKSKGRVQKSAEQRALVARATSQSPLFEPLTPQQMEEVIDAMVEEKRTVDDVVIKQGDLGNHFYVVATGEYSVYLNKVENGTKCVKVYQEGETFGELALMYNTPRAATVTCSASGTLFSLDRKTFRSILMAANLERLDSTSSFLKSIPIFSPLTDGQRDALSNVLEECKFVPSETIVREVRHSTA